MHAPCAALQTPSWTALGAPEPFCGPEYDRLTMRGNRYTMREEADYGIFQYDNMLDFDQDRVDAATTPDNSNGFNPYLYAKYPGNGLAHV